MNAKLDWVYIFQYDRPSLVFAYEEISIAIAYFKEYNDKIAIQHCTTLPTLVIREKLDYYYVTNVLIVLFLC